MQRRDQMLAAAEDVARQAAPELELSVDLECLPPKRRLKSHAMPTQPQSGFEAVADQHLGQFGVAAVLGQPAHVVEVLAFGVAAEVDGGEIEVGDVGRQLQQLIDTGVFEAECAAGESRVAAACLLRRGLDHRDRRARLVRRQCRIGRGIAGTDHQHVDVAEIRRSHAPHPRNAFREFAIRIGGTPPAVGSSMSAGRQPPYARRGTSASDSGTRSGRELFGGLIDSIAGGGDVLARPRGGVAGAQERGSNPQATAQSSRQRAFRTCWSPSRVSRNPQFMSHPRGHRGSAGMAAPSSGHDGQRRPNNALCPKWRAASLI